MNGSVQIASLVVRTRPGRAGEIAQRLAGEPGTEVHAVQAGKIVVVVEAKSERALAEWMDTVRRQPDVLMVNLVYHQVD